MTNPIGTFFMSEFNRLRAKRGQGEAWCKSKGDQAAALGVRPSHFSKILQGRVTDNAARRMAEEIWADAPQEQKRFAEELKQANEALVHQKAITSCLDLRPEERELFRDRFVNEVELFFGRLEQAASEGTPTLLLIEYRDFPGTERQSKYADLIAPFAQAVEAGLWVGIFQPFGPPQEDMRLAKGSQGEVIPRAVRVYRDELAVRVRSVCRDLKKRCGKEARQRVVLYEAKDYPPGLSGIQSRMVFVEYKMGVEFRRETWESISSDLYDVFLRRDPETLNWAAFVNQFHPIYEYWRSHERLPISENLEECRELLRDESLNERLGTKNSEIHWKCPQLRVE